MQRRLLEDDVDEDEESAGPVRASRSLVACASAARSHSDAFEGDSSAIYMFSAEQMRIACTQRPTCTVQVVPQVQQQIERKRETRSRITLLAREKESLFLSRLCLFSALDLINNVQSSKALRKLSS